MRETSLDEWVGGDEEDGDGDDEGDAGAASQDTVDVDEAVSGGEEGEPEATEEPVADGAATDGSAAEPADEPAAEAVAPAVSTYDWTPGGADCEACGDAVARRWRDDDRLVCAECKVW